jgi:ribosomal-protein-alanine acetyltransferase
VSDKIVIRVAQKRDLPDAMELERANFSRYALSARQLRYHLWNERAVFLVAEREGVVVGDAIGLIRKHNGGLTGRVYSLVVDEKCRGEGIGRRLFEAVVQALEKRGAGRIYLEVAQTNRGAIGLYERVGFREIGVLRDYYARGEHAIHMKYERGVG